MKRGFAGACVGVAVLLAVLTGCDEIYYPFVTTSGAIDITYELTAGGSVSIPVRNCYLNTVRTLVSGETQAAGSHSVNWDLTDDDGDFVENGLYTVEVYLDGTRVDVQLIEVDR
jgi:flagellar hook assembly protein FlgD